MFRFGEVLRELRTSCGMTQADLASQMGVTITQYQRYEKGASFPHLESAVKLAEFFDVSLDYLVGRSEEKGIMEKNEDIQEKFNKLDAFEQTAISHIMDCMINAKK